MLASLLIALAALGLVFYLLWEMNQFRQSMATFLRQTSQQINQLTQEDLKVTVQVKQSFPISTSLPIHQNISLPVKFMVNDTFPIKATIPIHTQLQLPISTTIPIDQVFNVALPVFGQEVQLPLAIRGSIPVNLALNVPFDQNIPIQGDLPIQMPIDTTFPFVVTATIPIQSQMPVDINAPLTLKMADSSMNNLGNKLQVAADQMSSGPNMTILIILSLIILIFIGAVSIVVVWSMRRSMKLSPTTDAGSDAIFIVDPKSKDQP